MKLLTAVAHIPKRAGNGELYISFVSRQGFSPGSSANFGIVPTKVGMMLPRSVLQPETAPASNLFDVEQGSLVFQEQTNSHEIKLVVAGKQIPIRQKETPPVHATCVRPNALITAMSLR